MKKLSLLMGCILSITLLQFCTGSKKAVSQAPSVTYVNNIQQAVSTNCTPCHFPPKGRVKALDTYTAVKDNIDDIISRIQRNPDERGFMPMKHPKLPDSTITLFVQWKNAGTPE